MTGATRLKVRIGPGTEVARELGARRDDMLAEREQRRQPRVAARAKELEDGHVLDARELALLMARRDAVAREAEPRELAVADVALRQAVHTGKLKGVGDLIERMELSADRSWTIRTRQVLVLDRLGRSLPSRVRVRSVVRDSDNALRMHARLDDGRELVIAAGADEAEEHTQMLDIELAGSHLDRAATEIEVDADAITAALCERLFFGSAESAAKGHKEKAAELGLASIGFMLSAASFPTEWQGGEYVGVLLTAVAVGMLLARHFRQR